jgi:hypothetical protein
MIRICHWLAVGAHSASHSARRENRHDQMRSAGLPPRQLRPALVFLLLSQLGAAVCLSFPIALLPELLDALGFVAASSSAVIICAGALVAGWGGGCALCSALASRRRRRRIVTRSYCEQDKQPGNEPDRPTAISQRFASSNRMHGPALHLGLFWTSVRRAVPRHLIRTGDRTVPPLKSATKGSCAEFVCRGKVGRGHSRSSRRTCLARCGCSTGCRRCWASHRRFPAQVG